MGESSRMKELKRDLQRQNRELGEWVRKEIDCKMRRSSQALAKMVEKQKDSLAELGADFERAMERRIKRRLEKVSKMKRRIGQLSTALAKIEPEALLKEVSQCRGALDRRLKAKCQQLDQIRAEQERLIKAGLDGVLRKSSKVLDEGAEKLE